VNWKSLANYRPYFVVVDQEALEQTVFGQTTIRHL